MTWEVVRSTEVRSEIWLSTRIGECTRCLSKDGVGDRFSLRWSAYRLDFFFSKKKKNIYYIDQERVFCATKESLDR